MNWSNEQQAIFDWFEAGTGNLIVKARAGTGKTTTIKAAFAVAPERRILYAVFNKKNQKEAEEKITDTRVEVRTLHSLGFAFIKRVWSNAKPDSDVEAWRANKVLGPMATPALISGLCKLVGFAKNLYINPTLADMAKIVAEQDIEFGDTAVDYCAKALDVLALSKLPDPQGRISFDDMVWLPVANNLVRPWYNLVCIDEAQDMNLPQLVMARSAKAEGGRVVVVGDDRQAIYGFRGAVQDGMSMMKVTLRAQELSLTTTYRCPKSVVTLAREIVPDYRAADEAPDGEVATCNEFTMLSKVKPGHAILSRLNAPLMPLALGLIRRNIPARIEGRDIGKQLAGILRSLRASSVPDFMKRLDAWAMKQRARLESTKNADKRIEQVNDVAQTLGAIAEGAASVEDIGGRLDSMFQDSDSKSPPAVVLSSVHKAKGLEWPHVYVLSETFRQKVGTGEEANIYYVAVTRAQKALFLVAGKGQAEPQKPAEPTKPVEVTETPAKPESGPISNPEPSVKPGTVGSQRSEGFETPPPGTVWLEPGIVFRHAGVEYVSVRLGPCNATAVCLTRQTAHVRTSDGQEKDFERAPRRMKVSRSVCRSTVSRKMEADELEKFLSGKSEGETTEPTKSAVSSETKQSRTKERNSMAKLTMTGSAQYVRSLVDSGKTDAQIKELVPKKFPWFADGNDAAGLMSRINTARTRAKNAEAKKSTKATAAPAKAPAKKGKAPVKSAAKIPAKKAATKKAVASTPPPRPSAAAPAPVAEPVAEPMPG